MAGRKIAIITLLHNVEVDSLESEEELGKQIKQAIASSTLSKAWTIDRIAFLEDALTDHENLESQR